MKYLILLASLSLLHLGAIQAQAGTISSGGDCFPVEWNLPEKGNKCDVVLKFGNPLEYTVWDCNGNTFLMEFDIIVVPTTGENKACLKVKRVLNAVQPELQSPQNP